MLPCTLCASFRESDLVVFSQIHFTRHINTSTYTSYYYNIQASHTSAHRAQKQNKQTQERRLPVGTFDPSTSTPSATCSRFTTVVRLKPSKRGGPPKDLKHIAGSCSLIIIIVSKTKRASENKPSQGFSLSLFPSRIPVTRSSLPQHEIPLP
jgi:hypothetical protein